MTLKQIRPALVTALVLATGCGKPSPATAPAPPDQARGTDALETVARIHWIGRDQLAVAGGAPKLMSIWDAVGSRTLENQTLDNLAAAPWSIPGRPSDSKAGAQLRPLLDDVLVRECFLEIRSASGSSKRGQLAFAIRLDAARAALWQANLAAALQSLTGTQSVGATGPALGWSIKQQQQPSLLELTRVGDWTVFGAADDRNDLLFELVARIGKEGSPVVASTSNAWLEASLDLGRLAGALKSGTNLPGGWPRISLAMTGDGTNVRSRGEFVFPNPHPVELDPWTVPLSIMNGPMIGFTAARGFGPWLGSIEAWKGLQIGPAPNQLYLWALGGQGMDSFGAAPLPGATNAVGRITDRVLKKWGAVFATNELARFVRSETSNGLEWRGLSWLTPYLQSVVLTNGDFVFGGLFPNMPLMPPPPEYFDKALVGTNLVYYNWEETSNRVPQLLYIGQFTRFVSQRPQMPFQCASLNWLKEIGPQLGESVTRITATGPGRFAFERTSAIGLTAIELHLMADWFESPRFPEGFHTLLAPPD